MIEIHPIRPDEIQAAKLAILSVAYKIYGWEGTLEDSIRHFEETGEFKDMDEVQSHYFDNDGFFLAALDEGRVIGSGGVRKINAATAELKRMWLLEDYHGRGIGYQIITRLIDFARGRGYTRMILRAETVSARAIAFYHRVGFRQYRRPDSDPEDVDMEMDL
jgi:putative acetyltransferase